MVSTEPATGVLMARDSAVPRSDVLDKTELLIVLPTGLVAQGQNRLFLAGFDFARCLFWFPIPRFCFVS